MDHQFHAATELTGGVDRYFSMGAMLLTAVVPNHHGLQYAGWKLLPHLYLPDTWRLPFALGLVAEFEFSKPAFDETAHNVEIRPIIRFPPRMHGLLSLLFASPMR